MKNLVNLVLVVLLSLLSVACKSPSATSSGAVDTTVADTTTATDAVGNTTTTSTAADGTITTTITSADGTSVTTVALPAEVDNLGSAGGVWRGTFTPDDKTKATVFYKAFITPSRKMVMLSDSEASFVVQGSDVLQSTEFSQTSDGITINLKEYVKENDGAAAPVDVVIIGNLTPTDNIKGTYTRAGGAETGVVLFIYDPVYERGDRTPFFYTQSTYWRLSKTLSDSSTYKAAFSVNDSFKVESRATNGMDFTFDPESGDVIGATFPQEFSIGSPDSKNCLYDGNLDIIDTHYFIFNLTLRVRDFQQIAEGAQDDIQRAATDARVTANALEDSADTARNGDGTDENIGAIEARIVATVLRATIGGEDDEGAIITEEDALRAEVLADGLEAEADRLDALVEVANINVVLAADEAFRINAAVAGGSCELVGSYSGLATLEEEYTIEEHPHTHYEFMTFGVTNGVDKTINNRLTLDYFGV